MRKLVTKVAHLLVEISTHPFGQMLDHMCLDQLTFIKWLTKGLRQITGGEIFTLFFEMVS
ncbi:hypothetical protein TSH7_25840 [Azospirillum sp. TSH7]|nr:hypothetical protein TSH7_25840 [Azospirillum sp. TSH7]PWC71831.1 hypothetical protein TSH20_02920 [Azospirillum sp. TSH20]